MAEEIRMREFSVESAEKRVAEVREQMKSQEEQAALTAHRTEELMQQIDKVIPSDLLIN